MAEEFTRWMGYDNEEEMDKDHALTHEIMCEKFNVPSYSLAVQEGLELTDEQFRIASMEEQAVVAIQRWLQHLRIMNEHTH